MVTAGSGERGEPSRALVFGGGGVLGFAWMIGGICALQHHAGFETATGVDLVVGTSAGAVVAAVLACGVPADQVRRHHQGTPAPGDPMVAYDYALVSGRGRPPLPHPWPGSPLLTCRALRHPMQHRALITALVGAAPVGRGSLDSMADMIDHVAAMTGTRSWPTRPRLWLTGTDYRTGQGVVFGHDPTRTPARLADAVVASCAVPGWYPPTIIDDRPYIDGGINSSTSAALLADQEEIEQVYIMAPGALSGSAHTGSPIVWCELAIRARITRRVQAEADLLRRVGKQVTVLAPGQADLAVMGTNLMASHRRVAVLESAYRTVTTQLAAQPTSAA